MGSVVAAEEYYLLSDRIVGHLGCSARRRRRWRDNLRPACAVETPCVVSISCAVESAKCNTLAADRIVGHCKVRTCRRRTVWRKLDPIGRTKKSARCTRCKCDRNATADDYGCLRKVSNLSEFHRA